MMRWGVSNKYFYLLVPISTFFLSACSVEPVTLRHPETGQVVRCAAGQADLASGGPFGFSARKDMDRCVEDYETAGFTPMVRPASEPVPLYGGFGAAKSDARAPDNAPMLWGGFGAARKGESAR